MNKNLFILSAVFMLITSPLLWAGPNGVQERLMYEDGEREHPNRARHVVTGPNGTQEKLGYENRGLPENSAGILAEFLSQGSCGLPKSDYTHRTFWWAVRRGHIKTVQVFLANDSVDINACSTIWHQTALHIATQEGHLEIVQILLNHDANPNLRDIFGEVPLHIGTRYNRLEIMKTLLAHSARPHIINLAGATPLFIAILKLNETAQKILIEDGGADPHFLNILQYETGMGPEEFVSFANTARELAEPRL